MNKERTRILIVDDEEIVRESLSAWLRAEGYTVDSAPDGRTALDALAGSRWSIVLLDLKMPGMDGLQVLERARPASPETTFVVMTAFATVDTAVAAIKLGAYDYLVKPFDPEEMSLMIEKILGQQALVRENVLLRRVLKREYRFRDMFSKNARMQAVFQLARTAARSHSTILVLGESGSGKEVLARAIHAESQRQGPFVAVSCAALTETLLESELFGHEKGAFTGAVARQRGRFEVASGGTLLLDEIGDIGSKLQLDLLRVLEERKVTRLGGHEAVDVDVRIVAATNRDLTKAVADGTFREDLYYRLNVIPIVLPPLRERREDIPLLVDLLVEQLGVEAGRTVRGISGEALRRLMAHEWPGNIRELRNVLERAIVVATGPLIQVDDLGLASRPCGEPGRVCDELCSLEDVEHRHVARVLELCAGNVTQAAHVLGIDRVTLYNKIRKYGLRDAGAPAAGAGTSAAPLNSSTER